MTEKEIAKNWNDYKQLKAQIKELEGKAEILKFRIQAAIPDNEEKAGIRHRVSPGKSVSWAKINSEIVKSFVPKTKYSECDKIVKKYTNHYERHIVEDVPC